MKGFYLARPIYPLQKNCLRPIRAEDSSFALFQFLFQRFGQLVRT